MTTFHPDSLLSRLKGGLVVSCQSLPGSAMDRVDIVLAMAQAAVAGGACAVRIEGVENVRVVAAHVDVPVIGIVKRDLPDSPVRISPWIQDTLDLAAAGAHIVAFDATHRTRPVPVIDLLQSIRSTSCLAMADCATLADGIAARDMGCTFIGTTLSGYTAETTSTSDEPNFALVGQMAQLGMRVVAEGRIRTPAQAAHALETGAFCVTVGSAITRIEHITSWFTQAMSGGHL